MLLQLLVATNVDPSSLMFHPDDGGVTFLQNNGSCMSHTAPHPKNNRHENLKSDIALTGWVL
jgi:hypothetical protein